MQPSSAVFLPTPKIATDRDNLTGNLTDRVLVKLSESCSLPVHHGMMDVGSLGYVKRHTRNTHKCYWAHKIHSDTQTRWPAIFPRYKRIWAHQQPNPFSIKSTSCAGGWNRVGLESGRPNPSVRGRRGVCHPPLWAPSSWKREGATEGGAAM